MKKLIRVLIDFTKIAAAELLTRAKAVYAGLNLNPAYPKPPVPLPELGKAIDDYSEATTLALDGGAKAIAERNARGEALRRMLRLLGHYVEANCNDDMITLLSSGFQPGPQSRTRGRPVSGSIRQIGSADASGQIRIALASVRRD